MDLKKYWPYFILIAGAIASVIVIIIFFVNLRSDDQIQNTTASSTPTIVTKKEGGFFTRLFGFSKPATPAIPAESEVTSETPVEETTDPIEEDLLSLGEETEIPPEDYEHNETFPQYNFAPTELPPAIATPKPVPDTVYLEQTVSTGTGNPDDEYVIITASYDNKASFLLSGMKLRSSLTLNTATIGQGVQTYLQSQENLRQSIYLKPGASAYVFTGKSPLSYSFRLNKCMGFLEQFHFFNPSIFTDCPMIQEWELPTYPNHLEDKCLDYIDGLAQCHEHTEAFPLPPDDISIACQNFIRQKQNYRQCVSTRRNNDDFHLDEWRIFNNRSQEMWKPRRENIQLIDQAGKVISEFSY